MCDVTLLKIDVVDWYNFEILNFVYDTVITFSALLVHLVFLKAIR